MFRVAYRSVLRPDVGLAEIAALLQKGADANESAGIASVLLKNGRVCLHALEGPPKAVRGTLERIWDDRRNDEFAVLDITSGDAPLFNDWPLKVIHRDDLIATPALRSHPGVTWLANLDGGLDRFFGCSTLAAAPPAKD